MGNYLSKSDFKVARDCATKLFYKKNRYPTTLDDDGYMELLADGGFMVGKFAQLQNPAGVLVAELDPDVAVRMTAAHMATENIVLFEPAFLVGGCLVRIDVLEKVGQRLRLIEVKSKGYDPATGLTTKAREVRSDWVKYIEDIAFQRMVLERAYPAAKIECYLLLPDKSARAEIDLLPTQFSITRNGRNVDVTFAGDPDSLRQSKLLQLVPVDAEVASLYRGVCDAAAAMLPLVISGPQKAPPSIGYKCRDCEYRVAVGSPQNGFRDCWGELAKVSPALLDLYQLGRIKGTNKELLADSLIRAGQASLFDVPAAALTSAYADRQRIQISHTKADTEWRSAKLRSVLDGLAYPLHFIDFETSRLVLPYHRGMRPFEQVAFQWSCHTIEAPGGELKHSEWINVEEAFPNVRFASALRDAVGDKGTLLMWSHHERTTLDDIARQIADYRITADPLRSWLTQTATSGRMFDMCELAAAHYFHPKMKGSTSIKAVLPAVWGSNAALRNDPWFKDYLRIENGAVWDPYETLEKLEIYDRAEVVTEGTGAMRAYQEMVYGSGRTEPATKESWRKLLLQYCKLDTLAMVIIWKHWLS